MSETDDPPEDTRFDSDIVNKHSDEGSLTGSGSKRYSEEAEQRRRETVIRESHEPKHQPPQEPTPPPESDSE